MSDDLSLTPSTEPRESATSGDGPGDASGQDQSASAPPDLNEMQKKLSRLEANISGTTQEWQRERERRLKLEEDLLRMQQAQFQQQSAPAPQPKPTYREYAQRLSAAVVDGKDQDVADTLAQVEERAVTMAEERILTRLGQAAQGAQRQQSLGAYMAKSGITDPSSAVFLRTRARMNEIAGDPNYGFIHGNNEAIAALAASEVLRESAGAEGSARESARKTEVTQAFSEPAGGGTGAPPGKSSKGDNRIYLTPDEKRTIEKMAKARNMPVAEAERRYWENINHETKQRRLQAGKAVL